MRRARSGRATAARRPSSRHYHRAWLATARRDVLGAPRTLAPLPSRLRKGRLPGLAALGLDEAVADPLPGGEQAGRARMNAWLRGPVTGYVEGHEDLGRDATSRLSAYLRFGCVSRASSRIASAAERAPRPSGASCAGATSTPRCFSTTRATRGTSSAEVPRSDQVEPLEEAARRLAGGRDGVPSGRRRHAPAPARGLHAQPRAARRRIVSHQGPRDRLARGRALVHALAARR